MLTDEEYEAFSERCKTYGMSQAEMIRQSITGVTIRPIIKVSAASDELILCWQNDFGVRKDWK